MNEIIIDGDIGWWGVDASFVRNELANMSGDVTIKLDSPGGSVTEGIGIYNAIRDYNKGSVTVEVMAVAASIASYFAMAADKVKVCDNSIFMIHNAWMPAVGDHRELRKAADIAEGLTSLIAKSYTQRTGRDDIAYLMDAESYFYGEAIVAEGFADEVIAGSDTMNMAEAIAFAAEHYKATAKAVNDHYKDDDMAAAAKLINMEQPTPSKKVNTGHEGDAVASKIRAMKARLNLKEKELNHG